MKAIEQYFHVLLFIMLYNGVLTFKSVEETLECDHSNESFWAVLSCDTVYYAAQGGFYFCLNEALVCDHLNEKLYTSTFIKYGLLLLSRKIKPMNCTAISNFTTLLSERLNI